MDRKKIWINNTKYLMKKIDCNCNNIKFNGRSFDREITFGVCTNCVVKSMNEYTKAMNEAMGSYGESAKKTIGYDINENLLIYCDNEKLR